MANAHAHSNTAKPASPKHAMIEVSGVTKSVEKALALLSLFRGAQTAVRIAEASEAIGLARSTTHRLMATLEALGFVRQDPATRAYFVGESLLKLARSLVRDVELREVALTAMQGLVKRTSETASLVALRGAKAYFLESVESPQMLRTAGHHGDSTPAHATSAGKALLAELTPAQVAQVYPKERLARLTRKTISTRRRLLRELAEVRSAGYAVSVEESHEGVNSIAYVIKSRSGKVYGALTVAAPSIRMPESAVGPICNEVRRATELIASRLP